MLRRFDLLTASHGPPRCTARISPSLDLAKCEQFTPCHGIFRRATSCTNRFHTAPADRGCPPRGGASGRCPLSASARRTTGIRSNFAHPDHLDSGLVRRALLVWVSFCRRVAHFSPLSPLVSVRWRDRQVGWSSRPRPRPRVVERN